MKLCNWIIWVFFFLAVISCSSKQVGGDGNIEIRINNHVFAFRPDFTVIYTEKDPNLAFRPSGIPNVQYNVPVWNTVTTSDTLAYVERTEEQYGDGFDDSILERNNGRITPNVYKSGEVYHTELDYYKQSGDTVYFVFRPLNVGNLQAKVILSEQYPILRFEFFPEKTGFYSIGYTGAPEYGQQKVDEIWQPLIWQEKRIPTLPYMTMAYRCPIPTALMNVRNVTLGVVAKSSEFPFMPLPTMDNSRFGVVLINSSGHIQPQLFAPVLGGQGSEMDMGDVFRFSMHLYVDSGDCSMAFEQIGKELYGFKNYRRNVDVSLNRTLDNMIDYAMSPYSMFVDSLKGCNYSTDAPGTVKNVSALNPLQTAIISGREDIYAKRAYPMIEYMLSRDKFLFAIDSTQKIQYPSRKLTGPCAPISELVSLYLISDKKNPFLLDMALKEFSGSRVRNLAKLEFGGRWQNALALYRATSDQHWLDAAKQGADVYLKDRVYSKQKDFSEQGVEYFFWTGFTPDWVSLFELYETTGDKRYLDASHKALREYAMFVWFAPQIPEDTVLVNPDGLAPYYPYLRSKGYERMVAAPEKVPAWRLSEIGLTSESSGTSTGHRGVFMANYAPWMLRIGYLTNDSWLQDIARSAIIGRYQNFPGYHINTERTTIYEKETYPYKKYDELSVNSFHYNHIWPHINILTDFLVTDAYVRSEGNIVFPSEFVEGFAYLQSKYYGHAKGCVYGYDDVQLFLPQGLLTSSSCQLNYIAGYNKEMFFLAFMNQSPEKQSAVITLNDSLFGNLSAQDYNVEVWQANTKANSTLLQSGKMKIDVPGNGLVVTIIKGLSPTREVLTFPCKSDERRWKKAFLHDENSGITAMLLQIAGKKTLFIYSNKDDSEYDECVLYYKMNEYADWQVSNSKRFPFEYTVTLPDSCRYVECRLDGKDKVGKLEQGLVIDLYE